MFSGWVVERHHNKGEGGCQLNLKRAIANNKTDDINGD